jgi:isopropylmalate/homocitrate/citramalate synthase/transcriptional regulator with XRE-family HTH domain
MPFQHERLRLLMAERGMKQNELAERLSLSTGIVSSYLSGSKHPSDKTLVQIAGIFGASTDYLLGISEQPGEKRALAASAPAGAGARLQRNSRWGVLHPVIGYPLLDVTEPNLLRETFPYDDVPRMAFDGRGVPMEPAPEMFITDTTFRDGQQARPPYKVEQIVRLYDMLGRLGGPHGVIRACEFFLYSEKDKAAVRKCRELGRRYPEVTGWIRAVKSDFQLVKELGLKETGILTSASDYHIYLKLKKTRAQAMDDYLGLVTTALDAGLDAVRCHLEDITRADFYGFIVPYVQRLMELARQSGKAVKIRLCDTMGFGLPFAEATLPRSIPKMLHALRHECGVPSEWLEWHGHNDFHKVLANATTAWLYGCAAANCTLLGFGERTGNPPLEGAVMDYIALRGEANGIDTRVISEIAEYFTREIGIHIPPHAPFVGANFNVTSAGIHADGMLKNEEIYNIFDTGKLLDRPARVNVTDKSGVAGIAHWANSYLGLREGNALDKRHPGLLAMHEWVKEQYAAGRVTSISDEEMLSHARMFLPEYFKTDFDLLRGHALDVSEQIVAALAEHPAVQSMDHTKIEAVLQEAAHRYLFIQFVYVVDAQGLKITENITQPKYREQYSGFGLHEYFNDREWFKGAIAEGGIFITDFYKSRITNVLCITVSAPIFNADSEVAGVLGADLNFAELVRMHEAVEVK